MSEEEKKEYIGKLNIAKDIFVTQHKSFDNKVSQDIFGQIVCLFNFNQLPQIVADEEFEKIPSDKYYRGAKAFAYTATLLTGKKYHYGSGFINGIFVSNTFNIAHNYTRDLSYRTNPDKVLTLKIAPKIGVTYKTLTNFFSHIYDNAPEKINSKAQEKVDIIKNFHKSLPPHEQNIVYHCLLQDVSKLGVILGYDFVIDDQWGCGTLKNISILNRAIIKTTQSEVDRFVESKESWFKDPNMQ